MPNFDEDWFEEVLVEQFPQIRKKFEDTGRLEGKLEGKLEIIELLIADKGYSFDEACDFLKITDELRESLRSIRLKALDNCS